MEIERQACAFEGFVVVRCGGMRWWGWGVDEEGAGVAGFCGGGEGEGG